MPLVKYRIYELSARAVISYGRQQDGIAPKYSGTKRV